MKIITIDIETFPLLTHVWGIRDENIGLEQIERDTTICAFGAKWLDNDKVIYQDTSKQSDIHDDKKLCLALKELLDQTEIVISQNGQAFDTKKINTRLLKHKIAPPSPYKHVDTYLMSKKYFNHTSNKLQWVTQEYTSLPKFDHKEYPGFTLWLGCLQGNKKAWKVMKEYNIRDVRGCEEYYLRIREWIQNHPRISEVLGACPACGSLNLTKRGFNVNQVTKTQRLQCTDCGSWTTGQRVRLR